jgi:hypothetical protein
MAGHAAASNKAVLNMRRVGRGARETLGSEKLVRGRMVWTTMP